MSAERTCPGCGGKISRRAQLCNDCRLSANAIGATVVSRIGPDAGASPASEPSGHTPGQSRAYHGKCGSLARLRGVQPQEIKKSMLERASAMLGREITSSKQLNQEEMSDVLDLLDEQIGEASQCA